VTMGCLVQVLSEKTRRTLKEHTVCVARHHWMPSTGHDPDYGWDMLRGGRNCHTSTKIFHFSTERDIFGLRLTGRPQLVGKWSMMLSFTLHQTGLRVLMRALI
jgi:hypothetical protein